MIELRGVSRVFAPTSNVLVEALRGVSLSIAPGELVAIVGQSGSGKTTLMNIIGCLDQPSGGEYLFADRNVRQLHANDLARLRRENFGFVFQNYNLIATASVLENIEIPGVYAGCPRLERLARASEMLATFGISECDNRLPRELSGGQQQRAAIARALVNGASVILADEPTGALDSRTGEEVVRELTRLADEGRTVIMVTHDPRVAARANRRIELVDGQVVDDTAPLPWGVAHRPVPRIKQAPASDSPWGLLAIGAEMVRSAVRSLGFNLLRTSLTLLGIMIGVASVAALMLIVEGSRRQVMESVYEVGADLMTVRPNPNAGGLRLN